MFKASHLWKGALPETAHAPMEVPLLRIPKESLGDDGVENNTVQSRCDNSDQKDHISLPYCQDDGSGQREERGLYYSSQQKPPLSVPVCCCSQNKTSVYKSDVDQMTAPTEKLAVSELDASLPRFGPLYGEDIGSIKSAKEEAWRRMNCNPIRHREIARHINSIRKFYDEKAKDICSSHAVNERMKVPDEFAWRMLKDGCFFLQMALYILGGGKHLGYPPAHPYFGAGRDNSEWMHAMFFAGNQIPDVVIRELMKEKFFKDVIREGIKGGTWSRDPRPPKRLLELALYQTVLAPNIPNMISREKEESGFHVLPSDISRGLYCLFLRHGNDPAHYKTTKEFRDVETGREEDRLPSAEELKRSGIKLKKAKEGIQNIRFWSFSYLAYLYVPPFKINGDTEVIFKCLMDYERQLAQAERQVTAYVLFMSDLIQTYNDFKILKANEIIQIEESTSNDSVLRMLNNLVSSQKSNFTPNLRQTRRLIAEYRKPPWELLSWLLGLFTVVQTVLAILSYLKPLQS